MMELEQIDHIGIRVMAFQPAIAFYERLGFTITREHREAHVIVMRHPSGIEINLLDSGSDDNEGDNVLMDVGPRYPGYTHFALRVPSINEAQAFLEAAGLVITEGPVTFGGEKRSVFVRDPDANVIEFTELLAG